MTSRSAAEVADVGVRLRPRLTAVWLATIATVTVGVSGCADGSEPTPSLRPGTTQSPLTDSGSATPGTSPSWPPDLGELPTPPQPSATGAGRLLGRTQGSGPGQVHLGTVPRIGSDVTLRLSCSGPGKVWITDRTGGEIMGTSGCQLGVVYSVGWRTTSRDGSAISIAVNPATQWIVDVWLGTPPARVSATPSV